MLRPGSRAMTVLLATLTGIAPISTSIFMPSLPDIARTLEASPAEVQLSVTAYLFGLAIGQIVYGPISDRHGRKPVMLAALSIFCAATLVCVVAPSVEVLILGRALQAVGGAGAIVVTRAVVRDTHEGAAAARELAILASFMSLAPIVAPVIGGVLQELFGWRSTFVALLVLGVTQVGVVVLLLTETLKHRSTQPLSFGATFRTFGTFLRDPAYVANVALGAGVFAGGYAWLSGSAFVLQDLHGLRPVQFSIVFAVSCVGYLVGNAVASRLVMRRGIPFTVGVGVAAVAAASAGIVAAMAFGFNSAPVLTVPATLFLAGMGLVMPQTLAGALTNFPHSAGAASSLAGFIQQGAGGLAAAVVGYFLADTEWPVIVGVAAMGAFVAAVWMLARPILAKAPGGG